MRYIVILLIFLVAACGPAANSCVVRSTEFIDSAELIDEQFSRKIRSIDNASGSVRSAFVADLKDLRAELESTEAPACADKVKSRLLTSMQHTINGVEKYSTAELDIGTVFYDDYTSELDKLKSGRD